MVSQNDEFGTKEHIFFLLGKGVSRIASHGGIAIRKKNPLPRQPVIYVANHPSTLDPFFVLGSLPRPVSMLISHYIFQIPLLGVLLKQAGHVKVTDGRGREAYEQSLRLLQKNCSLLIFPEGAVSADKSRVGHLFSGAVRLAMETHTPIVPIGIYLDPQKIRKHTVFFGKKKEEGTWYSNGVYGITYGTPVAFEGDVERKDNVEKNTGLLRGLMDRQIAETSSYVNRHRLKERKHFNLLSVLVYLIRLHFAYTNWVNSS